MRVLRFSISKDSNTYLQMCLKSQTEPKHLSIYDTSNIVNIYVVVIEMKYKLGLAIIFKGKTS